jgi:ParB family chromosome partitioning protein
MSCWRANALPNPYDLPRVAQSMIRPKGLGRGLDALLGADETAAKESLATLPVASIRPGKYQPRTKMDKEALGELAASIKSQGLMQPLLVRPVENERYELIAGERRWRAAQLAGLSEVPVVIRDVSDESALAMALIENIQREDLNPMEEAAGLQRLIDEFKMTHEQAADAVGRSRSATTNLLRLLKLAAPVQGMVMDGELEMGHARALLTLDGARQIEAAHRVTARGLSVRETEALVQKLLRGPAARRSRPDRDLARLEEEMSERLGTTVEIKPGRKGSGKLVVHYSSLDHLEQFLNKLR